MTKFKKRGGYITPIAPAEWPAVPAGPAQGAMTLDEKIRWQLDGALALNDLAGGLHRYRQVLRAVLDLKPPEQEADHEGDLLGAGWATCHESVRVAIAKALGVEP